jgi:DNA-binding MarR family transcriptional regulator
VARVDWYLRRPAARSGISPTQLVALSALAKHPDGLRQGDLAELMSVAPPTMSRLVDLLSEPGWVSRDRDPEDHRAMVLTLTDAGRSALERARDVAITELSEVLGQLSGAEVRTLEEAVPVLRKVADLQIGEVSVQR